MKTAGKKKSGLGRHPGARLFEQAQGGCMESLELLMIRHEPLVLYAVNRQKLGDLPYEEAVQAGRIGLWGAIQGYDPDKGYQFSTYAYAAIVHQVWAAVKDHCVANGREHATREWAIFFRHWEVGPAETRAREEVRASLNAMVRCLPKRLGQIMVAYYGLAGKRAQSQREIGAQMGITQQRISQLKEAALVWLRHPAHSHDLRTLLRRHSQQEYEWAEELAQNWLRRRARRHG